MLFATTTIVVAASAARHDEVQAQTSANLLASWNDGPAKQAILDFVRDTTDPSSKSFVPLAERIATFDQDGTLWVEQPLYSQLMYCLERVPEVVRAKPELAKVAPFKTVLSGDLAEIGKLSLHEFEEIAPCAPECGTPSGQSWIRPAFHHSGRQPA
jgi:hypothetical protein